MASTPEPTASGRGSAPRFRLIVVLHENRSEWRTRRAVLIAASKAIFKLAESRNAMNTIRRYAADDAHAISGTAHDEGPGDQLRATVIATGLFSARKAVISPPLMCAVQQQPPVQHAVRTGTDKLPSLNQVVQPAGQTQQPPQHSEEGLQTPSVWRSARRVCSRR